MGSGVLARSRATALAGCTALAALLAGCSGTSNSAITVTGNSLSVYASEPPGVAGQQSSDTLAAEQLALTQAGGQAGKFKVRLVRLHGRELSDNARSAIEDKTSIAYLGELVPGSSAISVPITNELDLLQVSPGDTASYLTRSSPVVPDSPAKFYPSSKSYGETFARDVPTTSQEARALAQAMASLRVSKLYVADDGQPYGATVAASVAQDVGSGVTVKKGPATVAAFKRSGADAMFLGTNSTSVAGRLFAAVAATSRQAKLFGPSALYSDALVSSLPVGVQRNVYVSSPGFLPADLTPAGRKFVSDFKVAYGRGPAPTAIFGYEAMAALLAVIRQAGPSASVRKNIVQDFRGIKNRPSALGTYSLSGGDTNLAPFVIARIQSGALVPFKFFQG
jgi:ABC-type branched-subunit amino acid transport system substrate-binding protein